ncbi:TFIID-31kDa-domain-containing protein [Coniochaeta ligniaria NRRL 30616]|uniref:TFIID-31kDa-domain-containing protein n=1 Tax=Coniochaeta ligniaria NRRL 30616 TaxID=1408157 RepID=A0A1J7I477_9PEZI|nr:TFIID-31kDa-domain-containing protein [Coniochaeta ligniaria NRRL 30616]
MATATSSAPQTNGIPPSSAASGSGTGSQTLAATTQPQTQTQSSSQPPPQSQQQQPTQQSSQPSFSSPPTTNTHPTTNPQLSLPRPRDARTLELLLTAQGVTSFEPRVPLLLLDFAYRHTSSILSDALHLSADPYVSHAGAKPSALSGAAPVNVGDATVSANAVHLAVASRLGYQFRAGGGAASKEWMLELARERNKVALPKVAAHEWGVRLPNERFVLSGVSWGLRDVWAGMEGEDDEEGDEEEEGGDDAEGAMEGVEMGGQNEEDVGGDGVEGGTMGDVFGDDIVDEEMAEE